MANGVEKQAGNIDAGKILQTLIVLAILALVSAVWNLSIQVSNQGVSFKYFSEQMENLVDTVSMAYPSSQADRDWKTQNSFNRLTTETLDNHEKRINRIEDRK